MGVVSRRLVCLVGVVVKRYIDIPISLVSALFFSSIHTFCNFFNVFRSCSCSFL